MDVDAVNHLTALTQSESLREEIAVMNDDTIMHDSGEPSAPDYFASETTFASSVASSGDNIAISPQVEEMSSPRSQLAPPRPVVNIAPTIVEVQPVFFAANGTPTVTGPTLKQQATPSEVLMDVTLIRTGASLASENNVNEASSPSTSSAIGPPTEASVYPTPSVEIVANV